MSFLNRSFFSPVLIASLAGCLMAEAFPGVTRSRIAPTVPVARIRESVALGFSGALATVGGGYGGTFLLGVAIPVERNSPFRLGFDSGVMFSSTISLPILLSVVYNLGTPGQGARPYIGGAVGPFIRLSSARFMGVEVPGDFTGGDVRLGILIRPGIRVALTENLDLMGEIPLGGLTGVFYISPTLGVQIKL